VGRSPVRGVTKALHALGQAVQGGGVTQPDIEESLRGHRNVRARAADAGRRLATRRRWPLRRPAGPAQDGPGEVLWPASVAAAARPPGATVRHLARQSQSGSLTSTAVIWRPPRHQRGLTKTVGSTAFMYRASTGCCRGTSRSWAVNPPRLSRSENAGCSAGRPSYGAS
jgi:hypothetical protein